MKELTLRQMEVVRAVMIAGSIQGAANLLHVSAPGISRLIKHTEDGLGFRLFERRAGVFVPAPEAHAIFAMLNQVYHQVENLNAAVSSVQKGQNFALSFASAPSIAQFIAARAIRSIRARFPDLMIDLNILKIEETLDYLLLEQGEAVFMSSPVENSAIESTPLVKGRIVAILPEGHELAAKDTVSVHDLMRFPFIGVDPDDPYGDTLARPFREAGLTPHHAIRGRFAQTMVSLVRHGLGVAAIDEFSVAEVYMPGLVRRPLTEKAEITAYVVQKRGRQLSSFAEFTIERFRHELTEAASRGQWDPPVQK
ncbi:MAG: LysR family transcriptional regulator [Pseudotabrizicola sp.]|uniref:LysR family transcriptional regulator n=1 Tax=Pseudotabrizicola sp. TaxID=2939647 RepID=UPI00272739CC|nr:LysR family transcriptional regulator [Pseudotabrizicola sp.]MDO8882800.1 LysR family transcriptional regulator [Pseudotabrizicola sp.]MDP2080513.1 LysR family transcriptional regulator [Pseudotabrizicola sp.]MDZ7573129.1 LysR family transcriptional regulator [Pseudotabrizicola sp.]